MSGSSELLTVAALVAEREGRRQRDREAGGRLQQKGVEELTQFRQRLDNWRRAPTISRG